MIFERLSIRESIYFLSQLLWEPDRWPDPLLAKMDRPLSGELLANTHHRPERPGLWEGRVPMLWDCSAQEHLHVQNNSLWDTPACYGSLDNLAEMAKLYLAQKFSFWRDIWWCCCAAFELGYLPFCFNFHNKVCKSFLISIIFHFKSKRREGEEENPHHCWNCLLKQCPYLNFMTGKIKWKMLLITQLLAE